MEGKGLTLWLHRCLEPIESFLEESTHNEAACLEYSALERQGKIQQLH